MSSYERNKGVLKPVDVDTEHFTAEDWDTYLDNGFVQIGGELFEVEWEVEGETDDPGFCEVVEHPDRTISFHSYHYNGAAAWQELVEEDLEAQAV